MNRKLLVGILAGLVAVGVAVSALSGGDEPTTPVSANPPAVATTASAAVENAPALTVEQKSAAKQAENYLNVSAFSRSGLIKQLEFEGYSTGDATLAVDSISVDWMTQAQRKAADYVKLTPFSRSKLIKQLEFDGFTTEQSAHGATAVGL